MKFRISKETLVNGLAAVQGALPARTTLPVLNNVLVKAERGRVHLTTTDMDMSVVTGMEATVSETGAFTLPMKRLSAIAREAASTEVDIETNNDEGIITTGSATYKLKGVGADDFPALPNLSDTRTYTLKREDFRSMLQRTAYAVSSDQGRLIMTGVLLEFKDQKLTAVATDGRRMALVDSEIEFPKEMECDFIIPSKAVAELLRSMAGEGPMKIRVERNQIAFDVDDYTLMTKLIEGTFPNFRQVIPGPCEHRVMIAREDLLNAIRRVTALTSDQSIGIMVTFSKNKLDIFASDANVGEARETLAVKYEGSSTRISYQPTYLMEPLKALVSDNVYFEFNDDISPGVLKTEESFLYVIMPMRV